MYTSVFSSPSVSFSLVPRGFSRRFLPSIGQTRGQPRNHGQALPHSLFLSLVFSLCLRPVSSLSYATCKQLLVSPRLRRRPFVASKQSTSSRDEIPRDDRQESTVNTITCVVTSRCEINSDYTRERRERKERVTQIERPARREKKGKRSAA